MASTTLRSLAVATILAGAGALSACGAGTADADLANGKQQFVAKCGGCHVMEDAGTVGVIGPNLDDAFRQARSEEFPASHFQGVVKYWIAEAEQNAEPKMPRDLVTGKDADDVAAYVAVVAGAPDKDGNYAASKIRPAAPAQPAPAK